MSISDWEKSTVEWATFVEKIGVKMGNLSQFGDHPMADSGAPSE
jgi:hypothetical protein